VEYAARGTREATVAGAPGCGPATSNPARAAFGSAASADLPPRSHAMIVKPANPVASANLTVPVDGLTDSGDAR